MEDRVPAKAGMGGSDDSLSKDNIDDEEQDDACSDKNLGGNSHSNIPRMTSPDDPHDHCDDTSHAEAEEHA